MSFGTLSRRGKTTNHIKQSSFDVSELAAAGRLNSTPESPPHSLHRISPLKPFKRLSQFFRRQSSEPAPFTLSNQSIDKDHVFGRSLSDICTPELPKPILDLLTFLQEVGPFTREIFRKPPNAKRCRLLVDKLDKSSCSFQWEVDESCNGLLLAAVLKTFLREIPHKVCDDRMYNQWAAALQESRKDDDQQKIEELKRLISKLPESNQLLLRCIISVLYRIQQRSLENLMNSYNLSVCLGPCLLWTKSSNCREVEKASKIVPSLVEFLINNCLDVFGRNILSVLRVGDNSLARNTSMSLDSIFTDRPKRYVDSHSMDTLTDQLGRQQMSPSRLSFDSGMILDDVSQDGEVIIDGKPEPIHKRFNMSYDSLDCDAYVSDDDIHTSEHNSKHENNNSLYVNIPSMTSKLDSKRKVACESSGLNVINANNHLTKTSPNIHDRSSTLLQGATVRPQSCSGPNISRRPSVSYDKIVYRYISEPQMPVPPENKYYSLPRPSSKFHHSTRNTMMNYEHRARGHHSKTELTSVTCGQTTWQPDDVPIIVVDKCQQEVSNPKKHVTRLQILPNYPKVTDTLSIPHQQYHPDHMINSEPIYENSELYGPSSTLNRQRMRRVTRPAPMYENLPFHRQQPIIRSRSRNTTNSYSTYRQQTYHNRPSLFPVFEQRADNFRRSPQSIHRRTRSHVATMQETCYFV